MTKKITLSLFISIPKRMKAIVQFSHGMSEYKERYIPFIHYLNVHGYGCVIHDHRGHGDSKNLVVILVILMILHM